MKTKDEVLSYLKENGHTSSAIAKICGFMVGAGIKGDSEKVMFKRGSKTWEDFKDWYYGDSKSNKKCPLVALFGLLFKEMDKAVEDGDVDRTVEIEEIVDFLFSEFVIDVTELDDETGCMNIPNDRKKSCKKHE